MSLSWGQYPHPGFEAAIFVDLIHRSQWHDETSPDQPCLGFELQRHSYKSGCWSWGTLGAAYQAVSGSSHDALKCLL